MRFPLCCLVLFVVSTLFHPPCWANSKPKSYQSLAFRVWGETGTTLYCNCKYQGRVIDQASCSFKPNRKIDRLTKMEWEHVVPAHAFGQSFKEWREGHAHCKKKGKPFRGRKCARKTNSLFREMENNLYNIFPSVGQINSIRSNFAMAEIAGEERQFGTCDLEIKDRKVEPQTSVKGDIARAYLYMEATYPGRGIVSKKNRKLFEAWDVSDPIEPQECERYELIRKIQKMDNSILAQRCAKKRG